MTLLDRPGGLDGIAGTVLMPADAGFDEARQTFNGMLDKHPAAIVQCLSTADVATAVRAARAAGLPIAVRGGGHSVAGHCVADDALVVDLRYMRAVDVDPQRRIARAEGGAQWLDVDTATVAHGLATTGGTFVDTGIAGLTLTGGIGYLMGTGGFTCDTLVGAEVVTADGEVVRAGEDGDPELLWALRGGGGNFGVVTDVRIPPPAAGRAAARPDRRADRPPPPGARGRRGAGPRHARRAQHVRGRPGARHAAGPPAGSGGRPARRRDQLRLPGIGGRRRGGDRVAARAPGPARRHRAGSGRRPTPSCSHGPASCRSACATTGRATSCASSTTAAIDAVATAAAETPPGHSFLLLEAITGRARREPEGGAAFGQREARWNASALGIWEDPADDEANIAWVRRTADGLKGSSYSGAGYGNYAQADEPAERVKAAFGDERWDRLRAVKRRYDPDNLFRFNHNIPPADA